MSDDISQRKGRHGLRKGRHGLRKRREEILCVTWRLPLCPLRLILVDEYETK